MTRIGRPMTGTAVSAGALDGRIDAINERGHNPQRRWRTEHPMRPTSDWPAYRDAYNAAFAAVVNAREGVML